jgi:hypothetical protein
VLRDRRDWDYDAEHRTIEKTFDHPLLRRYLDEEEGYLENVRVYNHFRIGSGGRVLMQLSDGAPLLAERRVGRGRVLLLTSSLGGGWNTLPVRNQYVNFLYAWLTDLAGGRDLARNLWPGDALIVPAGTADVRVGLPGRSATAGPLTRKAVDGREYCRFDDTGPAGEYTLLAGGEVSGRLVVREPLCESDTLGLTAAERDQAARQLGALITPDWAAVGQGLAVAEIRGRSLVGYVVLLLMLCLLTDAVLTRIWFR